MRQLIQVYQQDNRILLSENNNQEQPVMGDNRMEDRDKQEDSPTVEISDIDEGSFPPSSSRVHLSTLDEDQFLQMLTTLKEKGIFPETLRNADPT